jgi:uncharacterized protein YuzE
MAKEVIEQTDFNKVLEVVSHQINLPEGPRWFNYDEEADTLYVRFTKQPCSDHSELTDDGLIVDYRDNEIVGLTVVGASELAA